MERILSHEDFKPDDEIARAIRYNRSHASDRAIAAFEHVRREADASAAVAPGLPSATATYVALAPGGVVSRYTVSFDEPPPTLCR